MCSPNACKGVFIQMFQYFSQIALRVCTSVLSIITLPIAVGLSHLIGTNILRAYMHGYFMDIQLYHKVRKRGRERGREGGREGGRKVHVGREVGR